LCSGKKVNGKLNFDVVDDQVVARSLTDQNGTSAAPAVLGTKTPVKSEQADS
jgi:hypothetical protein